MERLGTIEIEVMNDHDGETNWWRKTLVGEEAKEWLRDHYGVVDDPRIEQDRAKELSLVLMAARDSQIDEACAKPDCEACQVFERGFTWLLGTLPVRYQRVVAEYTVLNHMVTGALKEGRD